MRSFPIHRVTFFAGRIPMSCVENTGSELVLRLTRKVEEGLSTCSVESLCELMKAVIAAKHKADSQAEVNDIYVLGDRVERRTIESANKETDEMCSYWKVKSISSGVLIDFANRLQQQSRDFSTAAIKDALRACHERVWDTLNQGSEDAARLWIEGVERDLRYAEEMLADPEIKSRDISVVEMNIESADRSMRRLEKFTHIRYKGLSRFAETRGSSANQILKDIAERIQGARGVIAPMKIGLEERIRREQQLERERLQAEYSAQQQLAQERRVEFERQGRIQAVESAVSAIERRNPKAGESARRLVENMESGDIDTARAYFDSLRQLDGVPPVLQEAYGLFLRANQKPIM